MQCLLTKIQCVILIETIEMITIKLKRQDIKTIENAKKKQKVNKFYELN